MYFGTTKINDMYFGTSPINEIWLGNAKIWERVTEYTYEIDNVSVNYLPTTYPESISPTGGNYANVIGRVRVYKNGVLETTYATMQLDVSTTSQYIIKKDNKLYFDIDTYGTTNMSTYSNPFYINVKTSYQGTSGPIVQVSVTPNLATSTTMTDYKCSATTNVPFLNYNQTSFTVTNKNYGYYRTDYTSGKYTTSSGGLGGYLYEVDDHTGTNTLKSTLAYNGVASLSVGSSNVNSYPLIYTYRLSHSDTLTGYDYFIYMIHKCQNNTTGMQMYYGTNKVDGWNIESSAYSYIANNGHTSDTTYTWDVSDNGIDIEEMNGVFKIYCDSSTWGDVTIYDNKGNSCSFSINS